MASRASLRSEPDDRTTAAHAEGVRVLLAEDNCIAAELLRMMGQRLGARIDWVENGLDAVDVVVRARRSGEGYALVLMDAMMPVMTGVEATRRIRAAGISAAELPIVAVTAATANEEVREMIDAGMQAYLAKPVTIADLSACIDAWVEVRPSGALAAVPATFASLESRYQLRKEEVFRALAAAASDGDACTEDERIELRNHLHKLAGTAGSFGDERLSHAAAEGAQLLAEEDGNTLQGRLVEANRLILASH